MGSITQFYELQCLHRIKESIRYYKVLRREGFTQEMARLCVRRSYPPFATRH